MIYINYKLTLQSIIMNRLFWLLALNVSAVCQGFSQELLYINVDPVCMDRYEYHLNGEVKGIEYISYRVRQSSRDFIFLEVGIENSGMQLSMPENAKDCRNVMLSPQYVEKINAKEVLVYVVRKAEIGYNVSQVSFATYQHSNAQTLKYKAYDLDFFCNLEHSAHGTNLAQSNSVSEIYFGGENENNCLKEYSFRKMPTETCKPNVDLTYIPEIGIIREITRVSAMNDHESLLTLVRINDVSLDTYMQALCDKQIEAPYMPTMYAVETTDLSKLASSEIVMDAQVFDVALSNTTTDIAYTPSSTMPTSYSNNSSIVLREKSVAAKPIKPQAPVKQVVTAAKIKCAIPSSKDMHIVQEGETLYGIARRYNLSVAQLKTWNYLTTNAIAPCFGMKLTPPVVKSSGAVKSYEAVSNLKLVEKGGEIIKKQENAHHHTVVAGETISGLAKQFGYTEERFRKINGFENSDKLNVGQIIKTNDCVCPIPVDYSATSAKISLVKKDIFVERSVPTTPKEEKKEMPKVVSYKRSTVYIVQNDETLNSIASQFNVSLDDLLTINGLEPNEVLIPNQRLFLD